MNIDSPLHYFQINSTFVYQDHQEDFEDPGPIVHEEFGKDVIDNDDNIYVLIILFVVKSNIGSIKILAINLV